MTKFILLMIVLNSMIFPVCALEIDVPDAPASAAEYMPVKVDSFHDGLLELVQNGIRIISPHIKDASRVSLSIICAVVILGVIDIISERNDCILQLAGSTVLASLLLSNVNAMIELAADTVREMCDYGKLLYPVMTTAMAAQGRISSSTALYSGSVLFDAILSGLISSVLIPMIYLFLALSVANRALGEKMLKKMADLIRGMVSWCLKTVLTIFTTYMSITGVISGTTDAAALKTTKVTISTVVPVIGGILSDSSEAILVSAGIMKNAAGVYGILAVLAIIIGPFLKIGTHYLLLKMTAAVCSILGEKGPVELIDDFSSAMGLLLGMTGAMCLLILISTVCFMKGVG